MIIDAHAHIWPEVRGRIGAGPTRSLPYGKVQAGGRVTRLLPPLATHTTFPAEVLLEHMDWAGVDRAVLLQGSFYGEANQYARQAVRRWPDRLAAAAYIDPRAADLRDAFHRATDDCGFRILKFELSEEAGFGGLYPDLRLDEEGMAWIWDQANRQGLVVTLDLGPVGGLAYQTERLQSVLDNHPHVKVVLTHLAYAPMRWPGNDQMHRAWEAQVLLARRANVWLDLAALPAHAAPEEYPYPTALRYIRRVTELVGPDRVLWGTDAPGLLVHATYPQLLSYVARHCDFLSGDDLAKILGGNAWGVYGWGTP